MSFLKSSLPVITFFILPPNNHSHHDGYIQELFALFQCWGLNAGPPCWAIFPALFYFLRQVFSSCINCTWICDPSAPSSQTVGFMDMCQHAWRLYWRHWCTYPQPLRKLRSSPLTAFLYPTFPLTPKVLPTKRSRLLILPIPLSPKGPCTG